jgi:hypothetical protein
MIASIFLSGKLLSTPHFLTRPILSNPSESQILVEATFVSYTKLNTEYVKPCAR